MSTEQQPPAQEAPASVLVEVSTAMAGLYKSQFGRGATKARTYWSGPDAITCFMEDTFTPTERNLVTLGDHAWVRDSRSLKQDATVAQFCEPVERIIGRTVRSVHSSTDAHADGLSTQTFLFYPEGREGPSRSLQDTHPPDAAPPPAPGSVGLSVAVDELTPTEHATVEMVRKLVASGTLEPLVQALRSGEQGLVDARDALRILVELDRERLVQIALDTVVNEYVEEPRDARCDEG